MAPRCGNKLKAAFSTYLGSRMPRRRPDSLLYGRRLAVADHPRRRLATTRFEKCSAVSGRDVLNYIFTPSGQHGKRSDRGAKCQSKIEK